MCAENWTGRFSRYWHWRQGHFPVHYFRMSSAPQRRGTRAAAPLAVSPGGTVALPELPLLDRADGGHLVVHPQRPVWERSLLTARELASWSRLVAATGAAMLECLPQLAG